MPSPDQSVNVPATMRAVVLTGHGDVDKLEYHGEWPTPTLTDDDVLIRVHACGMNNTDVNTRSGWYSKGVTERTTGAAFETASDDDSAWGGVKLEFPRIQGADVAGTVAAVGARVDPELIGRRVLVDPWLRDWTDPTNLNKMGYFGSECDGGYADYTCINHHHVHSIDSPLSDVELASYATAYVTAENMLNRASVDYSDTVLVTGASGGVGSALIQLCKRRGARVVALASEQKHEQLLELGASAALPRSPVDLQAELMKAIGSPTVNVVADLVAGDYWNTTFEAIERGGRYVCSGAIAGPIVDFDLRSFYLRDLSLFGATTMPVGTFKDLVGYIAAGELRPLVAATYPLRELTRAQQAFIDKKHVGNIVISHDK